MMAAMAKGGSRNLLSLFIVIGLVSIVIITSLLPTYRYIPPGNPPVNPPDFGALDARYSMVNRTITATDQVVDFDSAVFYYTFSTEGENTCLYGNLTADRPVRFIITDRTGYEDYRDTGVLTRYQEYHADVHQHDWEIVLPPRLDGVYVDQWYVIVSAFNYFFLEYDRHVSYFICEDRTPPEAQLNVPAIANGSIILYPFVSDLHCDVTSLEISINGTAIFTISPQQREYLGEFVLDTTQYENGVYQIEMFANDQASNAYTYRWWMAIANQEPSPSEALDIENIVRIGGAFSGIIAVVVIILARKTKKDGLFLVSSLLIIISIVSTTTTVTEPIQDWTLLDSFQFFAALCSVVSFFLYMMEKYINYRRRRPKKLKGKPSYIG
jgi:hypothetical protein